MGKVDKVQLEPVMVSISLIVVNHRGSLLCGRDKIEEFRKAVMFLVIFVHIDSQLSALLDGF